MEFTFLVMFHDWDNIYSCYFDREIFRSKNYAECEAFCFNYNGPENAIFIRKVFFKPQSEGENEARFFHKNY